MAVPTMYFAFSLNFAPTPILIAFVTLLGLGIGMEIPLISEILQSADSLPNVLFSDYIGGFLGGLAFPLLLLPIFGFFPTGALLALLNSLVAITFFILFKQNFGQNTLWIRGVLTVTILLCFLELYYAEDLRIVLENYYFGINRS
jgi:spermidine synthase